jgi:small conductance mechanosensitive channel
MIAWLGVNTSLFVALFAAVGLAVGMAMSGVFQNLAGGVMILILKPFRVGDWIEVGEHSGAVIDINMFNTVLRTSDNRTILLPNGLSSTGIIDNYNVAKSRRLEWVVSLADGTDFIAARKLLAEIVAAEPKIMKNPQPEVIIVKLNPNALDVVVRGWVASRDYWEVMYRINSAIYTTMPENGFDFDSSQSIRITSDVELKDRLNEAASRPSQSKDRP